MMQVGASAIYEKDINRLPQKTRYHITFTAFEARGAFIKIYDFMGLDNYRNEY